MSEWSRASVRSDRANVYLMEQVSPPATGVVGDPRRTSYPLGIADMPPNPTVANFLAQLPPARRKELSRVRTLILESISLPDTRKLYEAK